VIRTEQTPIQTLQKKYSRLRRLQDRATLSSKNQTSCRVCGSKSLKTYLELGKTPLANSYLTEAQLSDSEFKETLSLQLCRTCGLSQLTKVVAPERMYKNYLYVSSTPATFRDHCAELAKTAISVAALEPGSLVLDIASNDGCLLSPFQKSGMRVVGVEPAENLAPEANRRNIPTLCVYWSPSVARDIAENFGSPQVITSTNVLAHVDDVHSFVKGIEACLAPRGVWIIEVPYVLDFIRENEFDTAYHEHLSYFNLHAMAHLLEMHQFSLFDVDYFPDLHGGTLRMYAARTGLYPPRPRLESFLKKETAFGVKREAPYAAFAKRVYANKKKLMSLLARLRREKKVVWAYGASAKGNTLLNFFGITSQAVPVVIDDNPKKWKYYTPGSRMRITGIEELPKNNVDYLLLLAWNFKDEIMSRCRATGYRQSYLLPIPQARILEDKVNQS